MAAQDPASAVRTRMSWGCFRKKTMPTKPALGAFLWSSDLNYTTGPAPLIGTATKITPPASESDEGWNADQIPPAQWENFRSNYTTQWTSDWVRLGTSVADADAHIVETDSAGVTNVVNVFAGGHSQEGSALGYFGDGSDGALVPGFGSIVLLRDMYYAAVSMTGFDDIDTNGFRIYCQGLLNIGVGTIIHNDGGNGFTGASGGAAGIAAPSGSMNGGAAGGAGADGVAGSPGAGQASSAGANGGAGGATVIPAFSGGAGGIVTAPGATAGGFRSIQNAMGQVFGRLGPVIDLTGGGGGGSGASGAGGGGNVTGGGGAGGGLMAIFAENIVNDGAVTVNGGNGGAPESIGPQAAGSGSGGGGAQWITYRTLSGAGVFTATAGAASNGLNGGANGVAGSSGTVIMLQV